MEPDFESNSDAFEIVLGGQGVEHAERIKSETTQNIRILILLKFDEYIIPKIALKY